jgi:hypothetical protein
MAATAKKQTKRQWDKTMWERVMDAQFEEIKKVCGERAAKQANYGWGDATQPGRVDVATKVYGPRKVRVLSSTAEFPSEAVSHEWGDY